MHHETQQALDTLKEKTTRLATDGDIMDAIHLTTEFIIANKAKLDGDPHGKAILAESYELRADLLRQQNACEQACDDYIRAIELLVRRDDLLIQRGRLHAGLGAAHAALGESEAAARQWERAIDCFEKNDPPSPLDVAAMANNFGFLRKAAGDFDAAETAFLKAMEILHTELGEGHEETATVASNLGTLYQNVGHHDAATKMHTLAAKARANLFGDAHPDTARSNFDLGTSLAKTGDHLAARRHLEKALNAFDSLGREFTSDTRDVATLYSQILRQDGELPMAEAIESRAGISLRKSAAA